MKSRDSVLQKLRNSAPALNFPDLSDVQDQLIYRDHPEPVFKKLLQVFAERLVALKGEIYIVSDAAEAAEKLIDLLGSTVEGACLVQAGPLLNTVKQQNNKLTDYWDEMLNIDSLRFAEYVVGISEADCLVARTGSIVLRSTSAGGRRLSVLPPFHIVLARSSQLVPSLDHALSKLSDSKQEWSYAAVITGPSRTADIEKILVLGAHGPKRLAVVVIG